MISSPPDREPNSIAPPLDYSARSTQWKLMVVVALAMTALMSLRWFFPEDSWRWIVGGEPSDSLVLEENEIARKDPDTRMPRTAPEALTEVPGGFVLPRPSDEPAAIAAIPKSDEKVAGKPAEMPRVPVPLPKLTDGEKKTVEDNAVFRAKEKDVWFKLLVALKEAEPEDVAAASEGRVGFVQLFEQPEHFRGRVVTLRGSIRAAQWVDAHANDAGIRGYFDCWMMPAGGPTSPIRVYLLDLPPDFPRGDNLREDVEIHGYFFKRVVYVAKDTTRVAPVILAKSPVWTAPAARPAPLPPNYPALGWIALVTFGIAAFAAWMMFRSTPETPPGTPSFGKPELSPEAEEQMVRASLDELARRK